MRIESDGYKEIEIPAGIVGDRPVLIFRQPTNSEFKEYRRRSLPKAGRNDQGRFMEAREWFLDLLLVDCKNIEVLAPGGYESLSNKDEGWKDKIPYAWKEFCLPAFELGSVFTEDDSKKSEGPSES